MTDWCTIESDPGVFTELINSIGVKNVQVEEIYSLDDQQFLNSIKPLYGLIFLFKWTKQIEQRQCLTLYDQDLFFANQVINNACATQAIISVLLNTDLDVGDELKNFKAFTYDMDAQMKGLVLSNSDVIRTVHNSFAKPEPFIYSKEKVNAKDSDDVFHFISYVPFKNKVYELDGLQKGPIFLGEYENESDWINFVKVEINKRVQSYSGSEIRFNLMAVIASKQSQAEQNIKQIKEQKLAFLSNCSKNNVKLEPDQLEQLNLLQTEFHIKDEHMFNEDYSKENIKNHLNSLNNQIQQQLFIIDDEIQKQKQQQLENQRRKHNYIPFIVDLLKLLAKKGKLQPLIDEAIEKQKNRS